MDKFDRWNELKKQIHKKEKRLNENKFYEVTEKVKNLLPQRESGLSSNFLSSNFINNIISQKTIKLIKYSKEYEKIWDDFVKSSKNGTIFHTRRFLSYHPEDRFEDNSILIYKKNKLIGVFPAVEWENKIISHRGSTYGGLVVGVKNNLKDSLTMWEEIVNYYQKTIEFRKSEYIFEKYPSREVIFAAKNLRLKS